MKQYIAGWTIGALAAAYGIAALLMGKTFLPGLHGTTNTIDGRGGLTLAIAYLSGGLFLVLRFALEKHQKGKESFRLIYTAENFLLMSFIAAVIYVLIRVNSVQ